MVDQTLVRVGFRSDRNMWSRVSYDRLYGWQVSGRHLHRGGRAHKKPTQCVMDQVKQKAGRTLITA